MIALSFLVMIGLILLIEGWDSERAHDMHLKNYVYFAMAFSFGVELLNMKLRKKSTKKTENQPIRSVVREEYIYNPEHYQLNSPPNKAK